MFINKSLLEEHVKKFHMETPVADTPDGETKCKCVYPCIPLKAPVAASRRQGETYSEPMEPIHTNKQIHCALNDSPECSFQCYTTEELKVHIEKTHRRTTDLQCSVCNL